MTYLPRTIEAPLKKNLERGKSILLFGARQTGKTTLIKHLNLSDLSYTLLDPELRLQFEKHPNLLRKEIAAYRQRHHADLPLVTIDEAQKVPALMDAIQLIIDNKEAQFILTGSSVRKLRRHAQFNLLPGRVVNFHLDPLSILELPSPVSSLESLLLYGSLPHIYLDKDTDSKQADLSSYVTNYLEEEVRGEALARDLGSFAQFLELAAIESGNPVNINKLSQELGISRHIIAEYFSVLEDCLITEKIEPITDTSSRKRLTKAPKYLFFDMGIKRIATREGINPSTKTLGNLFEQWVGLELLRILRTQKPEARLRYWRDHAGPEVDYVIEHEKKYLPIEVKWTATPSSFDCKHIAKFIQQYPCKTTAYVICRANKAFLLDENIIALPWQEIGTLFTDI